MKIHVGISLVAVALSGLVFPASGHPSSGIVVDQQGNVFFSRDGTVKTLVTFAPGQSQPEPK